MPEDVNIILEVKNLTKSFGGVKALENINFDLIKGEVHAIMGENGAGKSTFMKILMGLIQPDSGAIVLEGIEIKNYTVHEILNRGISMIHQEILAVPDLSISQNIFLGRESSFKGWINDKNIDNKSKEILGLLGIKIDVKTKIKSLSVAEQQIVEIGKAISNDTKIIIMDEPTSALSEKEVSALFKIINDLKAKQVSIIYISHKLEEIYQIADRITVLRDGKYIATKNIDDFDKKTLVTMMVGREIENLFPEKSSSTNDKIFAVKNLNKKGKFENINFEITAGEVFGIAGLMGAGRSEIARSIYGLDKLDSGEIEIKGKKIEVNSPIDAIRNGISYVGEDRKGNGFIPKLSVKQNLSLSNLVSYSKNYFIDSASEHHDTAKISSQLKIKPNLFNQKTISLSGGNQQKVVIGKALLTNPTILILDEPTRGVDIGAKFEIYKFITELTQNGLAVIMISSELPEIIGMCNRVMVISKGKQAIILSKEEITQENIMHYAIH